MYPLYTLAVAGLSALRWLLARKAGRLERRYTAAALAAEGLAKQTQTRPGNASHADVLTAAKRSYELGRLVQARDRLENKYAAWQSWAELVGRVKARMTAWRGRTAPYLLGAIDAAAVMVALGQFGVTWQNVEETVRLYVQK